MSGRRIGELFGISGGPCWEDVLGEFDTWGSEEGGHLQENARVVLFSVDQKTTRRGSARHSPRCALFGHVRTAPVSILEHAQYFSGMQLKI